MRQEPARVERLWVPPMYGQVPGRTLKQRTSLKTTFQTLKTRGNFAAASATIKKFDNIDGQSQCYKPFFFITDAARKKLERLLSGKSFQHGLIFPGKARGKLSGAPFRCNQGPLL